MARLLFTIFVFVALLAPLIAAYACPKSYIKSGTYWLNKYPSSRSLTTLAEPFKSRAISFVDALRKAGASVSITNTRRSPMAGYLMHYAWRIARENFDPAAVPAMAGVPICWTAGGKAGAIAMVNAWGIAYRPSLTSNHYKGFAVDMDISWNGNLNIGGTVIKSTPRTGNNASLQKVAAVKFKVYKLVVDPPHWSIDGR